MLSSSGWVLARAAAERRIQPPLEQPEQLQRDVRMGPQHTLHVGLAEGQAGLQQVAAAGAQHHDFAHRESGEWQQAVEAIVLGGAAPDTFHGGLEPRSKPADIEGGRVGEFKVLDPGMHAVRPVDFTGLFGDDTQAEVLHYRHHVRNRHRGAATEQGEVQLRVGFAARTVQSQAHRIGFGSQGQQFGDIAQCSGGCHPFGIGGGEHRRKLCPALQCCGLIHGGA